MKEPTMLPDSLEDMHEQTTLWTSEVDFWNHEIIFFQKLLYQYSVKALQEKDKKHWEKLNNRLLFLESEMLAQLKENVVAHEREVAWLITAKEERDEEHYRKVHRDLAQRMEAYESEFKTLKAEVYKLIEILFQFEDKKNLEGSQQMYSWL